MLLLTVGIMVVVDLFVLFSDIMQLGELMIRDLSRYSTKMLNYIRVIIIPQKSTITFN